jgi:hypothetical protein
MREPYDWKSVQGYSYASETQRITELAEQRCQEVGYDRLALEIGSYLGQSADALATYFNLISIDTHGQRVDGFLNYSTLGTECCLFIENIKQFNLIDRVFPMTCTSKFLEVIPSLNLDFVLIDGSHLYENCLADDERCHKHLTTGAYLLFHDFEREDGWPNVPQGVELFDGVSKAVREFLSNHSDDYTTEEKFHGLLFLRKTK